MTPLATASATRRAQVALSPVTAAAVMLLAVIASVAALHAARGFAIPTVLAGLAALALSPLASHLEATRLPRAVIAFALVAGGLAAVGATVWLLAPSADALAREGPEVARKVEAMARALEDEALDNVAPSKTPPDKQDGGSLVDDGRAYLVDAAFNAPQLAGAVVYGGFLTFFLLSERAGLARALLLAAGSWRRRLMIGRVMRDVRRQVASYLFAITVINVALGFATAGVFWALGMPNPAAWGAAMTLLNFMPYLGPILMNMIVLAASVAILPTPQDALAPVAALIVLNTVEGYVLTPSVVGRQARVGALAVFLAVAFGAWLWGAAGALIATPALIVLRVLLWRTAQRRGAEARAA